MKIQSMILGMVLISGAAFTNERGNGGDSVVCDGKLRTLDSVVMEQNSIYEIERSADSKESLDKIMTHLQVTLPSMNESLKNFIKTYEAKGDKEKKVFWIAGLPMDVKDENLFAGLPENCSEDLKQTVVRVEKPFTRFYYDPKVLNDLAANTDELSWMLVHEWLRDYVEDADTIRFINAYLHSKDFFNDNDERVLKNMVEFGINSNLGPLGSLVEGTNESISEARKFLKECDDLLRELAQSPKYTREIEIKQRLDDLSGLMSHVNADLRNPNIAQLSIETKGAVSSIRSAIEYMRAQIYKL